MISVIIPTLNEEKNVARAILSAQKRGCEVIVADGGSVDKTIHVARSLGCHLVESARGRSWQMNSGAAAAKGDILIFLHADSILPDKFVDEVIDIIARQKKVAGSFKLAINKGGLKYRVVEKAVHLRTILFKSPYGDQAIFVERNLFGRIGGYEEVEFLEDYLFIKKIKNYGKIGLAKTSVSTSPRRWEKQGVIKTTLTNQLIMAGYLLGFSIPYLKKFYGISQKG